MLEGEPHVGAPDHVEPLPGIPRRLCRGAHGGRQPIESLARDLREECSPVHKVVRRRRVGDPEAAREIAERERAHPVALDDQKGGLDERAAQFAMVIAARRLSHGPAGTGSLAGHDRHATTAPRNLTVPTFLI